jgi:hypothetical protein
MHTADSLGNNGENANKIYPSTRICVLLAPTFIAVLTFFGSSGSSSETVCTKRLLEIKIYKIIYKTLFQVYVIRCNRNLFIYEHVI